MAQFKSLNVLGNIAVSGNIVANGKLDINKLNIPTSSNAATLGPGANGQVLKSNGTSIYWGTDNNDVTNVSFTRHVTDGTKIGTIAINGTSTDIYSGTHNKVNQSVSSYDGWRKIMLSGQYATDKTFAVETTDDVLYASAALRCHPRTGGIDSAGTINAVTLSENGTTLSNKYQAKGLVNVTDTTPTSATKYFPIYTQGQSGDLAARANKDLYYYDSGTWSSFNIGGNANMGILTLHYGNSSTDYMVDIKPEKTFTANRSVLIPDKSGTLALTSDLANYLPLTGGTLTGTTYNIEIDGTDYEWLKKGPGTIMFGDDAASINTYIYGKNIYLDPYSTGVTYIDRLYSVVAPDSSGSSTYNKGSSGQVLTTNGTSVYWATPPSANNNVTQAYSTSTASFPLLMTATSGTTSTSSRGNTTTILNNSIRAIPSSGSIYAKQLWASNILNISNNTGDGNFSTSYNVSTNYYSDCIEIEESDDEGETYWYLNFPRRTGTLAIASDIKTYYHHYITIAAGSPYAHVSISVISTRSTAFTLATLYSTYGQKHFMATGTAGDVEVMGCFCTSNSTISCILPQAGNNAPITRSYTGAYVLSDVYVALK